MATSLRCYLTVACVLLAGCARGPQDKEVVLQVKRVLTEARVDCAIDVSFRGVGEGDSDHAYASIRLEAGAVGARRSEDVEVLISDWKADHWQLQPEASTRLVAVANQLCKN